MQPAADYPTAGSGAGAGAGAGSGYYADRYANSYLTANPISGDQHGAGGAGHASVPPYSYAPPPEYSTPPSAASYSLYNSSPYGPPPQPATQPTPAPASYFPYETQTPIRHENSSFDYDVLPNPNPASVPAQLPPTNYYYEASIPATGYESSGLNPGLPHNPNMVPPSSDLGYGTAHSSSYYDPYDGSYSQTIPTGGYYNDVAGNYGSGPIGGYQDIYGKAVQDDDLNDGAYAYNGGQLEPYGARGTVPTRSPALFDDYGRSLSLPSGGSEGYTDLARVVKAVPKVEANEDVKSTAQKFRVILLPEGAGQNLDVLCQIGLDGIHMLDHITNRELKVYKLDTITRCEILDSYIFAFWSKSSADGEEERVRLKSNSYTASNMLDTVTAATVQFNELGGIDASGNRATAASSTENETESKPFDWINFMKLPANEDKGHWVPDDEVKNCSACGVEFGPFNRRHHCRNCGAIFCDKCSQGRIALTNESSAQPVRVCDSCMAEVSHRLSIAKESANRPAVPQSHEALAKKLQEEIEKKLKISGSKTTGAGGSGSNMREVACPTCTVHLQVPVPNSGSETIECSVCQHKFLVNAY